MGAIAVALSVAGLYGVLIYLLGQRTREIGIRMALGPSRAAIARLVATQSARLAATGATIGVIAATGVLWGLGAMVPLRNVTWIDVPAIVIGVVLVGAAAALATIVPILRAGRIDPAQTLRADGWRTSLCPCRAWCQ